jgi:hypothetical protein
MLTHPLQSAHSRHNCGPDTSFPMRRALIIVCVTLGLAVPAVALAGDASEDGTLSVRYGKGRVQLGLSHGVVIGRLGRGSVRVDDTIETDNTRIDFWGCDRTKDLDENTILCTGNDIRFRVIGDRYRLLVKGFGIFLSAVGRGQVSIDGMGDPDAGIYRDGSYSLNGGPYQSLPNDGDSFALAPSLDGS